MVGRLGRRARGGQAGDAAETPAAASAAAAVPCKSAGSRSAAKMERMAKPGVAVQTVGSAGGQESGHPAAGGEAMAPKRAQGAPGDRLPPHHQQSRLGLGQALLHPPTPGWVGAGVSWGAGGGGTISRAATRQHLSAPPPRAWSGR